MRKTHSLTDLINSYVRRAQKWFPEHHQKKIMKISGKKKMLYVNLPLTKLQGSSFDLKPRTMSFGWGSDDHCVRGRIHSGLSNTARPFNPQYDRIKWAFKKVHYILERLTCLSKMTRGDFVCTEHRGGQKRHHVGRMNSYSSIWPRQ